jgi:hypothetical protein
MLSSRFVLRAEAIASGCFRRGWGNLELDVLRAEIGMVCGEAHFAGYFAGANPNGAGASDEREGIVADELSRAGELEVDGIVGEGTDGVEFVGNAQDNASGVGSVGN